MSVQIKDWFSVCLHPWHCKNCLSNNTIDNINNRRWENRTVMHSTWDEFHDDHHRVPLGRNADELDDVRVIVLLQYPPLLEKFPLDILGHVLPTCLDCDLRLGQLKDTAEHLPKLPLKFKTILGEKLDAHTPLNCTEVHSISLTFKPGRFV